MIKSRYLDLILPTVTSKESVDRVFIQDYNYPGEEKTFGKYYKIYPTDYAVLTGASVFSRNGDKTETKEKQPCCVYTKTHFDNQKIAIKDQNGNFSLDDPTKKHIAICPSIKLDASGLVREREKYSKFEIETVYEKDATNYVVKMGEYPQSYVGNNLNNKLEYLYNHNKISPTGKSYFGGQYGCKNFANKEYEFDGKRYVRTKAFISTFDEKTNGHALEEKGHVWTKVEPIEWVITNFDRLPKVFNPEGTGQGDIICLTTKNALFAGLPFYSIYDKSDDKKTNWENSPIRQYLNGNYAYFDKKNVFADNCFLNDAFTRKEPILTNTRNAEYWYIKQKDLDINNEIAELMEELNNFESNIKSTNNNIAKKNICLEDINYAKDFIINNRIDRGEFDAITIPFKADTKDIIAFMLSREYKDNDNVNTFIAKNLGQKYFDKYCKGKQKDAINSQKQDSQNTDSFAKNLIKRLKNKDEVMEF